MMGKNKEQKTIRITHSVELLIWLIIVLIITSFSVLFYNKAKQEENDYSLFMNDVDGLIVGSPVRMMGIEVGHVTKIKPTNEEVFIKFVLDDKSTDIPQGTVATVEFSGMAGSKSLELYLPDKNTYIDNNVPILAVNPPKRLHDAMGLLSEMFDKLGAIISTTTSFTGKLESIEIPHNKQQDFNALIDYSNKMLNDSTQKANNLNKKLNEYKTNKENGGDGNKQLKNN